MAARNTNKRCNKRSCTSLYSAVSEFSLIVLLVINAVLSYLATKLARFMKLKLPCIFCSRLDHILGHDQRGIYRNLLCHAHKVEVSALAYCQLHHKLGNARELCETCILSSDVHEITDREIKSDSKFIQPCSCCMMLQPSHRDGLHEKKKTTKKKEVEEEEERHVESKIECELKNSSANDPEIPQLDKQNSPKTILGIEDVMETSSRAPEASVSSDIVEEKSIHTNHVVKDTSVDNKMINVTRENLSEQPDIPRVPVDSNSELPIPSTPINHTTSDQPQYVRRIMERNDSSKSIYSSKGNFSSPRFSEILAGRESSRIHEDLKLRLSQRPPLPGFDTPWSDIVASPRQWSEAKSSDASSSAGISNVNRPYSYERSNSGLDFNEGTLFTEIDEEWSVERLRQQIERDRKSMTALYKELDEERNASAIAANEAMAMINRLQEEKAAMQMEALQCLRMMEEQAEYDQEAIQTLNDQLTEREKELLDFEAELESYRRRFGEESIEEKVEPLTEYET